MLIWKLKQNTFCDVTNNADVLVIVLNPSGSAYMGGQGNRSRRGEEFHKFHHILIVSEHVCDINGVTKITPTFCCLFWT